MVKIECPKVLHTPFSIKCTIRLLNSAFTGNELLMKWLTSVNINVPPSSLQHYFHTQISSQYAHYAAFMYRFFLSRSLFKCCVTGFVLLQFSQQQLFSALTMAVPVINYCRLHICWRIGRWNTCMWLALLTTFTIVCTPLLSCKNNA